MKTSFGNIKITEITIIALFVALLALTSGAAMVSLHKGPQADLRFRSHSKAISLNEPIIAFHTIQGRWKGGVPSVRGVVAETPSYYLGLEPPIKAGAFGFMLDTEIASITRKLKNIEGKAKGLIVSPYKELEWDESDLIVKDGIFYYKDKPFVLVETPST